MLQAYEGYLDDGRIFPAVSPIKITGRRKVIITVLDEEPEKAVSAEEKLAFWAKIDRMSEESSDENSLLDNFESARTDRELINFSDEG